MPAITVQHLSRRYGKLVAVDDISFDVEQGEIFGIVGPNGAGKTTTVECLQGLRRPSAGTVSILGVDPARDRTAVRQRVGTQLQSSELQDRLTVEEALALYTSFYDRPADPEELLDTVGLTGERRTRFANLSGGQKQRLSIALALAGTRHRGVRRDHHRPGPQGPARHLSARCVSPPVRRRLIGRIRDRGVTVLLVTHSMEEASTCVTASRSSPAGGW